MMPVNDDFCDQILINSTITPNTSSTLCESTSNYIPYNKRPETYIVPLIFGLIFVIGFIGNGLILIIFLRHKSMRTIPNTYIISLSIGDLLKISGALPFLSTIYTFESWPYGEFLCKLSEFLTDLSLMVTVLTLTILSVDRYRAIVMPLKRYTSYKDKQLTLLIAFLIWTLASVFAFNGFYNSFILVESVSDSKNISFCFPYPPEYGTDYPKIIVLIKFALLYAIPLIVTSFFYLLIAHHLMFSSKKLSETNSTHVKQIRSRTKVAKIVLSFIVLFAVCFFPSNIFMLWFHFYPNANIYYNDFWHYLRIFGFVLAYSNCCLNPVALYLVSETFRNYYKRYLFRCSPKKATFNSRLKPINRKHLSSLSRSSKSSNSVSF